MTQPSINGPDIGQRPSVTRRLGKPLGQFLGLSACGVVALIVALPFFMNVSGIALLAALAVFLVGSGLAGLGVARAFPHGEIGLCNAVTLLRLVLVAMLVGLMANATPPGWGSLALAVFALSLDGVDGWAARWQGLASEFGARFDVEVDAVFALTLALYAATSGVASPFILLLGLPHYLFKAAKYPLPWLEAPLPERFSRKAICVLQIAALIAAQVPFLPGVLLNALVALAAAGLIWSFGRDILWLWRNR